MWKDQKTGSLPTPCAAFWGGRKLRAAMQSNTSWQRLLDKHSRLEADVQPRSPCKDFHKGAQRVCRCHQAASGHVSAKTCTQHREGQRCEGVARGGKSKVSMWPQQGAGAGTQQMAGHMSQSNSEQGCSLGFSYGGGAALKIFKQISLLERLSKTSLCALLIRAKADRGSQELGL